MFDPNQIDMSEAIRGKKGILVAGEPGRWREGILASLASYPGTSAPRFVFSGEPSSDLSTLLPNIHSAGIPVAMAVQSSRSDAWDKVAILTGIPIEMVKEIFPIVTVQPDPRVLY